MAKKQEVVHIARRSGIDVVTCTETWIAQETFPNKCWARNLLKATTLYIMELIIAEW